MSKITIFESTGFLRIRIERLLQHYSFDKIELLANLVNNSVKSTFKETDLLIIDLDNYGFNVMKIIREIKEEPLLKEIPIILLSSQSDIKTLKEAIKVGCSEFVTKPFSDKLLMERIHKLTNKEYKDRGIPIELELEEDTSEVVFSWSQDYAIGIADIDKEHKSIIDSYEKLYHYMKNGKGHEYYDELVDFLGQYVSDHFAHEEVFQESIKYSQRVAHAQLHKEFKNQVATYINKHDIDKVTNMDLVKINLFLKDWLIQHILVEDAKIGAFIANQS